MRLGVEEDSHARFGASEPKAIKERQEQQQQRLVIISMEDSSGSSRVRENNDLAEEGTEEKNLSPETDPKKNETGSSTTATDGDNGENNLCEMYVDSSNSSATMTMPGSASIRGMLNYDVNTSKGELAVKIICLGDSAVGKSKLLERFLVNSYKGHQVSTYALTLYRYNTVLNEESIIVDFWDTAGQERFNSLHPSYYHQAHACIMVFDATRKVTYKNLSRWYDELRQYRSMIPCFLAANKIDANMDITKRQFAFATKNEIPFYFVSASDGTNVVKLFRDAIAAAVKYKKQPTDWQDQVLSELENVSISDTGTQELIDDEQKSDSERLSDKAVV